MILTHVCVYIYIIYILAHTARTYIESFSMYTYVYIYMGYPTAGFPRQLVTGTFEADPL